MNMNKTFGERLREEREKLGLTVEEIAKACGTSSSFVTLIENGQRLPSKKTLPKIATALQIKITVVLNWYLEDISQKIKQGIEIPAEK